MGVVYPVLRAGPGRAFGSVGGATVLLSPVPKFRWLLTRARVLTAAAPLVAVYAVIVSARRQAGLPLGWAWLLLPLVLPFSGLVTVAALGDCRTGFGTEGFAVQKGEGTAASD